MKPLSVQIREAIEASCVSRYMLAEQAGIAESVLSRFMSGKQGISSSTLDKIAEVLGLQVGVGVQEFRKSRKPGRRKKEEPQMQQARNWSQSDWDLLAQSEAKNAHEKNFPSRRGIYVVEGVGIVYYDNNPFKLPREEDRREELISQFRAFLNRSKINEKAYAYYPPSGKSKDYTFAMVIQADALMIKAVRIGLLAIVDQFVNGWHEGIDLGHPAEGDTLRYPIPLSAIGANDGDAQSPNDSRGTQKDKKPKGIPRRYRQVRDDASVAAAERTIAKTMGLPRGCIKLVLPDGSTARSDASIESLRARYE
jgi:transcriptional regulator with XRE-family HTH domain